MMHYTESEIRRIGRVAFDGPQAQQEGVLGRQMNVLETTQLWRDVMIEPGAGVSGRRADTHARRQCCHAARASPKQFDVMVTGNMFGDILSDEASMLTGSIGMLPSASLDANNKGPLRAVHGSAPGHRRQGRRQSAGDDPFGSGMMLRFIPSIRRRLRSVSRGGEEGAGPGVPYRRHLRAGHEQGRHEADGRRGTCGPLI